MRNVMSDILEVTDSQIDVLIATHEHWDHVSGFIQAADLFQKLNVGQVWFAWTEDDSDPLAKKLKQEHDQALAALAGAPERMAAAGDVDGAQAVADLMGFFGEMGAAGGNTTKAALDAVRGKAAPPMSDISSRTTPFTWQIPQFPCTSLGRRTTKS